MISIHALHEHVEIIEMTEYICKIRQTYDKDFVLEFIYKIALIFSKKYCNLFFELYHTSQDFFTGQLPHFCMKEENLMFISHFLTK